MDIENSLLLGAIGSLATTVVYLWRRIESAHRETRAELAACRADSAALRVEIMAGHQREREIAEELAGCRTDIVALRLEVVEANRRKHDDRQ